MEKDTQVVDKHGVGSIVDLHAQLVSSILEAMPDALIIVDASGRIIFLNHQTERLFGYKKKELLNQLVEELIPHSLREQHEKERKHYTRHLHLRMGSGLKLYGLKKTGECFPVDISLSPLQTTDGLIMIASIRDLTKQQKIEASLEHLAHHDSLTGLVNRSFLEKHIIQLIEESKQLHTTFALLFIDLDDFKHINDQYGHRVGDATLKETARRIVQSVRKIDWVSRIGGDEFVLLLTRTQNASDVIGVAKKILEHVRRPYQIEPLSFTMTASIGIVFYRPGDNYHTLLKKADAAMYHVKNTVKNDYQLYEGM